MKQIIGRYVQPILVWLVPILAGWIMLFAASPVQAEEAPAKGDLQSLTRAGLAAHQEAKEHVAGAALRAVALLEQAHSRAPGDAQVLAYLGSASTMAGRDGTSVFEKLRRTNQGIALLDEAVRLAPDDLRVRLIRAGVAYELPAMFHRRDVAFGDYQRAVSAGIGRDLPAAVQAEIFYKLGVLLSERKDSASASSYFQRAIATAPESTWAGRARKEASL